VAVERDKERAGLSVIFPRHNGDVRRVSATMVAEFLDAVIGANEEFPSVAGVVATFRGIRHHDSFGGTPSPAAVRACPCLLLWRRCPRQDETGGAGYIDR